MNYTPVFPGTLIFQTLKGDSAFTRAIATSALADKNIVYNHVGIAANHGMVIHSRPGAGVVIEPLEKFFRDTRKIVFRRVCDTKVARRGLSAAYHQIGRPYNATYYPNSDGLYCSELVTECYKLPGGKSYFNLEPMNFRDSNGILVAYWKNFYKKLGISVPEGLPGSHPNRLFLQREKFR
jgi:hypothetical protein